MSALLLRKPKAIEIFLKIRDSINKKQQTQAPFHRSHVDQQSNLREVFSSQPEY